MKKSLLFLVLAMFATSLFAQVPQYQRRQVASQWFMRDVKVGGTLTAGKYLTPTDTVALLSDLKKKLAIADTASLVATKSDLSKIPTGGGGVSQEQFDTTLYTPNLPPAVGSVDDLGRWVFYVVQPADPNYISTKNQWYVTYNNPDGGSSNWYDAIATENYFDSDGLQFNLPSKDELNVMYQQRVLLNLYVDNGDGTYTANGDSIFWSSTVDSSDTTKAWAQNFNTGVQFLAPKDSMLGQTYCGLASSLSKSYNFLSSKEAQSIDQNSKNQIFANLGINVSENILYSSRFSTDSILFDIPQGTVVKSIYFVGNSSHTLHVSISINGAPSLIDDIMIGKFSQINLSYYGVATLKIKKLGIGNPIIVITTINTVNNPLMNLPIFFGLL